MGSGGSERVQAVGRRTDARHLKCGVAEAVPKHSNLQQVYYLLFWACSPSNSVWFNG